MIVLIVLIDSYITLYATDKLYERDVLKPTASVFTM